MSSRTYECTRVRARVLQRTFRGSNCIQLWITKAGFVSAIKRLNFISAINGILVSQGLAVVNAGNRLLRALKLNTIIICCFPLTFGTRRLNARTRCRFATDNVLYMLNVKVMLSIKRLLINTLLIEKAVVSLIRKRWMEYTCHTPRSRLFCVRNLKKNSLQRAVWKDQKGMIQEFISSHVHFRCLSLYSFSFTEDLLDSLNFDIPWVWKDAAVL